MEEQERIEETVQSVHIVRWTDCEGIAAVRDRAFSARIADLHTGGFEVVAWLPVYPPVAICQHVSYSRGYDIAVVDEDAEAARLSMQEQDAEKIEPW